jgi:hypothetical protein
LTHLVAGTTSGDVVPGHYQFILGGVDIPSLLLERETSKTSFLGLRSQQLLGEHLQFAQVGVQFELTRRMFGILRANAGNTFDEWEVDFSDDRFESGVGATLGLTTPIGPVELTGAYGSIDEFQSYLSVGLKF